jgi:hypothetical protein
MEFPPEVSDSFPYYTKAMGKYNEQIMKIRGNSRGFVQITV